MEYFLINQRKNGYHAEGHTEENIYVSQMLHKFNKKLAEHIMPKVFSTLKNLPKLQLWMHHVDVFSCLAYTFYTTKFLFCMAFRSRLGWIIIQTLNLRYMAEFTKGTPTLIWFQFWYLKQELQQQTAKVEIFQSKNYIFVSFLDTTAI